MTRQPLVTKLAYQVSRLTRTIETKQAQWKSVTNVQLPHNDVYIVQTSASGGGDLNPLKTATGVDDPMGANQGFRIGDEIALKGMQIVMFLENALGRSKVYYRVMLVKCPRAIAPTLLGGLYQGNSANKMIDTLNSEKFTICWQKTVNIQCANSAPLTILPNVNGVPSTATPAGIGSRIVRAWIPGSKFGRNGILKYEDMTSTLPKFFDYKLVIVCYDWFGTPQTVNNVGVLNECYTKIFFKDS